jgi:hypothetical protein
MKTLKHIIWMALPLAVVLSNSSCVVVKHDNGKHKGWTKNSNNPHHPATTNPGHTKSSGTSSSNGNGNSKAKAKK